MADPPQLFVALENPVFAGLVLSVQLMVTFFAHVMVGGVLSSTLIVCTHVLIKLQSSMAFHVRKTTNSRSQTPATVTSVYEIEGVGSQASVAVALPSEAGVVLDKQSTVTFAGQVSTGGVKSATTIF